MKSVCVAYYVIKILWYLSISIIFTTEKSSKCQACCYHSFCISYSTIWIISWTHFWFITKKTARVAGIFFIFRKWSASFIFRWKRNVKYKRTEWKQGQYLIEIIISVLLYLFWNQSLRRYCTEVDGQKKYNGCS